MVAGIDGISSNGFVILTVKFYVIIQYFKQSSFSVDFESVI